MPPRRNPPSDVIPTEAFVASLPPPSGAIVGALRALVLDAMPSAVERVRVGWGLIGYDVPTGRHGRFFAWIWPQPEHVHLGFPVGALMRDPGRVLEGEGVTKQARWLTFATIEDIDRGVARRAIEEAARVAGLSREERELARLERLDGLEQQD